MHTMKIYSTNDRTAQNLVGSWQNAIDILNGRHEDSDELRDYARAYITNVIGQYTAERDEGLWDWVAEGDWAGAIETFDPRAMAQEWDESQRRWRAEQESYEAER